VQVPRSEHSDHLVEIRSYRLRPGSGPAFHRLVHEVSVPMLREFGTDVVAYGASLHDPDVYVLIRSYSSREDRAASQNAFYGFQVWKSGPREAIVSLIVNDIDVLVWLSTSAVASMRQARLGTSLARHG
jgi:hypothetical protein